ncbi:MAG: hypothetical protein SGARI_002784, partial [Bacillariaceae sp.]
MDSDTDGSNGTGSRKMRFKREREDEEISDGGDSGEEYLEGDKLSDRYTWEPKKKRPRTDHEPDDSGDESLKYYDTDEENLEDDDSSEENLQDDESTGSGKPPAKKKHKVSKAPVPADSGEENLEDDEDDESSKPPPKKKRKVSKAPVPAASAAAVRVSGNKINRPRHCTVELRENGTYKIVFRWQRMHGHTKRGRKTVGGLYLTDEQLMVDYSAAFIEDLLTLEKESIARDPSSLDSAEQHACLWEKATARLKKRIKDNVPPILRYDRFNETPNLAELTAASTKRISDAARAASILAVPVNQAKAAAKREKEGKVELVKMSFEKAVAAGHITLEMLKNLYQEGVDACYIPSFDEDAVMHFLKELKHRWPGKNDRRYARVQFSVTLKDGKYMKWGA